MKIAEALLAWYDENKRELPWRRDKDPYKIWVSEIMLQQTRVEAVRPYFEKWIGRFPDVWTLASADEEEVLRYWQGLGYYSRARNLLAGAREVVEKYDAQMPDSREETETIKGIGEYTAGAILSIAYNKKEAAVDGNVLRVFSRLFCLESDIMKQSTKKQVTLLVDAEFPPGRAGDFNQALMDLGARICIPGQPRCGECPLRPECKAYREGRQGELPVRSKAKAAQRLRLASGILPDGGAYLLRKRPAKGILAGMWEFPSLELAEDENPATLLTAMFAGELGQTIRVEDPFFQTNHTFSHRIWDITFYRCALLGKGDIPAGQNAGWFSIPDWEKLSLAGPHRRAAEFLRAGTVVT